MVEGPESLQPETADLCLKRVPSIPNENFVKATRYQNNIWGKLNSTNLTLVHPVTFNMFPTVRPKRPE